MIFRVKLLFCCPQNSKRCKIGVKVGSKNAASTEPLRDLAPYGGYMLTALSSMFGIPGIALAFYFTAKKERRKKLLAYLIHFRCISFCR